MIDSTKTPTPVWQRYAVAALLTVLIACAGYVLWSKELHHTHAAAPTGSAPAQTASKSPSPTSKPSHVTTIPGGVPVSGRDPFSPA